MLKRMRTMTAEQSLKSGLFKLREILPPVLMAMESGFNTGMPQAPA